MILAATFLKIIRGKKCSKSRKQLAAAAATTQSKAGRGCGRNGKEQRGAKGEESLQEIGS
jgi:hypothetical protein